MKKRLLRYGIIGFGVLAIVAVAFAATRRETTIWKFQNGITADDISAYTSGGVTVTDGMPMQLVFCGQMNENGTIYFSPTSGVNGVDLSDGVDYSVSGTACDLLDGATEGTQDLIVFPDNAIHVTGMYCQFVGTLGASETASFTLHDDTAVTTPSISCSLAAGENSCADASHTTTAIAAGSALGIAAVQSSNNSDDDAICFVNIVVVP